MKPETGSRALILALIAFRASVCLAAEGEQTQDPLGSQDQGNSVQPYIDEVRKTFPQKSEDGSFIESIRKDLPPVSSESYIEKLKRENPERYEAKPEGTAWIEERKKLLPEKESGGAISALHEGRSELKPRYVGDIHHAFGLRYGVSVTREITGSPDLVLRPFSDIFGGNYVPDIGFFYEYQLGHHEQLGSLGLVATAGVSYFYGSGKYKFNLQKPWDPAISFGLAAPTQFQFFMIPLSVGANYRLNLFHFLRPFVMAAPGGVVYIEARNDKQSGHRGFAKTLYTVGGVSILLDWLSRSDAWDSYQSFGIRHSYLTVQYERLMPLGGDLNIAVSGITAGVTFEY
jgi:hypothetical protein